MNNIEDITQNGLSKLRRYVSYHWIAYIITVVLSLLALMLSMLFNDVINNSIYLFYFGSIIVSAWYGGFGTGILATTLAIIFSHLFPENTFDLLFTRTQDFLQLIMFIAIASLVSYLEYNRTQSAVALKEAREQLEIILYGAADGITAQDENAQVIFANEAAARLAGFSSAREMVETPLSATRARIALYDEKGERFKEDNIPSRVALWQGKPAQAVMRMVNQETGNEVWITVKSTPVLDKHGKTRMAINVFSDITNLKRAEAERARLSVMLELQRQRLRNIVSNVPGVIWEGVGAPGVGAQKIEFVSDYAEKMLGYSLDEWRSDENFWKKIIHPDDYEDSQEQTTDIFRDGRTGIMQFRLVAKDGQVIPVEAHTAVMTDKDGRPIGVRGVLMDMTERKRSAEALAKYAEQLRRSNRELQQFAYVASHDLQEPLRMVSSYLQLLERRYNDKLDDDAREFIGYAVDGANRMKTLINDLLTYSRVDRAEKAFEEVPLEGILLQVTRNLQMTINDTGAEITSDPLPVVMADPNQMVQIFQNLIGNALKFRSVQPPRPPHIHIGVEMAQSGHGDGEQQEFILSVRDNGIGIEKEYLERIFVIFQRLHGKGKYPGTGIGLAICKKVVERHGGRIWVTSVPGEGTTFYFTLPVPVDALQPLRKVSG